MHGSGLEAGYNAKPQERQTKTPLAMIETDDIAIATAEQQVRDAGKTITLATFAYPVRVGNGSTLPILRVMSNELAVMQPGA